MANYDLTYEGSRVQSILDTGDELRDAGYIFRGEATPSTVPGIPTERVAYIGGPGTYTNFGSSITVAAGCVCIFKYTGSAWSNQVINTGLSDAISSEATTRSQADTALQNAINAINNNIGNGYVYAGVATPSTSPVTGKVFYLAVQAGTYTNFGNAVVTAGLNVIKYNGSAWSVDQVIAIDAEPTQGSDNLVKSGGVLNSIIQSGPAFDLSAYNAQGGTLATYADLSAALTALNALPADFKKGGMSMKFVQSSDNNYVQFRCIADEFTTDVNKWQKLGAEVTVSQNTLSIGSEEVGELAGQLIENPEWIWVMTDNGLKLLFGFRKSDGAPVFGYGCPPQVVEYVTEKLGTFNVTDYASIKSFLGELISGDTLATLLNGKVDKVDGKSLINSKVAENVEYIDNPEYLKGYTDINGKLYEGVTSDGKKVLFIPLFIGSALFESIDNPEYLRALTDKKERLVAGLRKDGTFYIPKLKSDVIDEILASIKGKVTPPLVGKLMSTIGDSTTAMERWQPTACEILGCTWDKSAISGGTLCNVYYDTVTAINLDSAIVTMQFGTNDWANTNLSLGNITDMADPEQAETPSYCGALNYSLKWLSDNLLYNNKNARVLLWTPLQRYDGIALKRLAVYGRNSKGEIINHEGKSLADFADAIIQIGAKWGFPVLDTHRICGFNEVSIGKWNENYVPSISSRYEDWDEINPVDGKPNFVGNMLYDGLHPDYSPGGRILGTLIANKIISLI